VSARRKWLIVLCVVGAVALAGGARVAWWLSVRNTPEYRAEVLVRELREAFREPGPVEAWLVKHRLQKRPIGFDVLATRLELCGKAAVGPLIGALRDGYSGSRFWAGIILSGMGQDAKDAVPALIAALKDPEVRVRAQAAYALGEIGPAARDAVPELIAASRDNEGSVRLATVIALSRIGYRAASR